MKRILAAAAALLLMALGSQVALAQYQISGTLVLSSGTAGPGGDVTASGGGFAPVSPVQITIESTPVLLRTVTSDSDGAFSTTITIPDAFTGDHTISATGTDPAGSVRVLASPITVIAVPATSTASDNTLVFAIVGAGIVALTGLLLFGVQTGRLRR